MIRLDDVKTFARAVESLSFSESAYQLNISLGLASAALQRLEKMLKTPLFTRSTQHAVVRGWGALFAHAQALLEAQRQGREARVYDRCELSGPLGLLVPSDFERNLMLAWMDEFQHQHPSLPYKCG